MSTFRAREEEDISHPAGRILELRQEGYNIQTVKIREKSTCGDFHIIAQYVLLPGVYKEQKHGL